MDLLIFSVNNIYAQNLSVAIFSVGYGENFYSTGPRIHQPGVDMVKNYIKLLDRRWY